MEEIPVIDISPVFEGDAPTELVDAIRKACTEIGFLQITGHGIPDDVLDRVYQSMEAVIGLPLDVKESLASPTGHPFRGLSAKQDDHGRVNVERLQVNHFDNADDAAGAGVDRAYGDYFHPNVWPAQVPDLEAAWRDCFSRTRQLGDTVMSLFASALDLPATFFAPMLSPDVSCFAVNAYPPQVPSAGDAPRIIFREHSDSGTLTLLHQRGDYDGLQIQLLNGQWINVPVRPDAFVINIGDLMSRWTNGRWVSTRHRVVAAEDEHSSRMSITTFHLPAIDTVIEPLPACIGAEGPKYDTVTPYVWEAMFLSKTYAGAPLAAAAG